MEILENFNNCLPIRQEFLYDELLKNSFEKSNNLQIKFLWDILGTSKIMINDRQKINDENNIIEKLNLSGYYILELDTKIIILYFKCNKSYDSQILCSEFGKIAINSRQIILLDFFNRFVFYPNYVPNCIFIFNTEKFSDIVIRKNIYEIKEFLNNKEYIKTDLFIYFFNLFQESFVKIYNELKNNNNNNIDLNIIKPVNIDDFEIIQNYFKFLEFYNYGIENYDFVNDYNLNNGKHFMLHK